MKSKYVFTIREVAELLRVDHQIVRRYIAQGKMNAIRLSPHTIRIPRSEVEYLLPKGGEDPI